MLGVLLLQQAHDLTDEETVSQLEFNIQWHYALNLTEESDAARKQNLSPKEIQADSLYGSDENYQAALNWKIAR